VLIKKVGKTSSSGFTLVELMIGIAIVAILVALGLPNYSAWIQNSRIRTSAESIQNGLQTARAEAVKRNTAVQFVLDVESGWTVSCVDATKCADLTDGVLETRAAGEGSSTDITVVTLPADSDTVEFNNLGTVKNAPVPFTQVDVSSSAAAADRPLRVTLGVGGNTRMCDPYSGLSATDPRKCL
jgi:type IV fimbrial biogenesis protein FimT